MKKFKNYIDSLTFNEKSIPIVLFVTCFLILGILMPRFGFYMDDWHYIFYAKTIGTDSLYEMLMYDSRPGAGWFYSFAFQMIGFSTLGWQITNFFLIFGTNITYWFTIRQLWRKQKISIVYITVLFAVYPFFMLMPSPIGYAHLWFGFITFNISIILMVFSINQENPKKMLLILCSLLLELLHLWTSEYFSGLEFVRVIILWILFSNSDVSFLRKIRLVFVIWLPYLLLLGGFLYWRIAIFKNPEGIIRNEPIIFNLLFNEPLRALFFLITSFIKDFISILTIGWQQASDVSTLNFSSPYIQFKLIICILGFLLSYFFFTRFLPNYIETKDGWNKNALLLAVSSLLTGGIPIWFIGRSIVESKNLLSASRFGIPAMFGASLLTFLIINYFISDKYKKNLFFAFLTALAINFHLDNVRQFQYSWEKQERFISQLLWRAPVIESGTAILTDQEILGVMGEYAVSFSINTAYQVKEFGNTPPYWYFPFLYTNPNIDELLSGVPLEYKKLTMSFNGNSNQILLLDFNPELNRCLWVLQPQDTNLRLVSEDVRKLSAGSNINLIKQTNEEVSPPEAIYGETNTQTWCYYFQKADLARQYQEWDEVVRLWNESQEVGERADNGFEYIPFIEGFGHTEDWEQVKEWTKFANRITSGLEPSLCSALDRLAVNAPESQERDETILNLKEDLNCKNFQ